MDIQKRSLAPLTEEAWTEIEDQAGDIFRTHLTGRKIVDVKGPEGPDTGAVNLGHLHIPDDQKGPARYGIHQVLPLVEVRTPFKLKIWELDNLSRGNEAPDLEELEKAARETVRFEENVIFNGLEKASIQGIIPAAGESVKIPDDVEKLPGMLAEATGVFQSKAIKGPYALVANKELWSKLHAPSRGYPMSRRITELIQGKIVYSPDIKNSMLVSQRGDDLRLTLGTDLDIGYTAHDGIEVELYFTESFTFQVIDPEAVIILK